MEKNLRNSIDDLAETFLSAFNFDTPLPEMSVVVRNLGGELIESDEYSEYSEGYIEKNNTKGDPSDGSTDFSIFVPKSQDARRKRFTVAHELGHLIIDMGYRTNQEKWDAIKQPYHRIGDSLSEQISDEFAAAILMPRSEYKSCVINNTQNESVNVQAVADYFNVSLEAARKRGQWLGILSW